MHRTSRVVKAAASAAAVVLVVCAAVVSAPRAADAAPRFHGSLGGVRLNGPIVAIARTPSSNGYHLFAEDGGVFAFGDAPFRGSLGGLRLNGRVVDGTRSNGGNGYYMVGEDGGVFAFGDAPFQGSLGGVRLAAPVLAIDAPSARNGYAMVAADGGVFVFGAVPFAGSAVGRTGGVPAIDIAVRPAGDGYWVLLADGRVFAFGAAASLGSTPRLVAAASTIQSAPDGAGYLVVAVDGGAFAFGSAGFHGSIAGARLNGPIIDAAVTTSGDGYWMLGRDGGVFSFPGTSLPPGGTPRLSVTPVATGLTVPWDLGFLPDGSLLFTERPGRIRAVVSGQVRLLATPPDVRAVGEGGMLGLAIDPDFATNRRVYTCFNTTGGDVQVVVWTIDGAVTSATRIGTLVAGLPANPTGRHSGCRPRVGPDGFLWVGTGDAATGTNPQDTTSLGGKVLRVDRFTGAAAPGNPFGLRWYTFGHRNVQGLAFRPGGGAPYSIEHGTSRDDEVNLLVAAGNYGWNPVPGYDESKPMTFAGGRGAVWSSGAPTIATSGAVFLQGPQWRDWDGQLAMCALAGSHLRVIQLDGPGTGVIAQSVALTGFGRLRTPVQGPDGNLYVTTSNGANDQILRVTPS
jgi:glucose/arabinose dehydrogenase